MRHRDQRRGNGDAERRAFYPRRGRLVHAQTLACMVDAVVLASGHDGHEITGAWPLWASLHWRELPRKFEIKRKEVDTRKTRLASRTPHSVNASPRVPHGRRMSIVRQERLLWTTLGLTAGALSFLDVRVRRTCQDAIGAIDFISRGFFGRVRSF